MAKTCRQRTAALMLLLVVSLPVLAFAAAMDNYKIGAHGTGHVVHPAWFKHSLLDLQGDLEDARAAGMRGIIIMFSQENCFHCQAFMDTTLKDKAIQQRVRQHYDVIGLDIFSDNELTYIDGSVTTVKHFAEQAKARLTPTLLFIGVEGRVLVKIIGFYPPEKFTQVLDYIDSNAYQRMSLHAYLQQTRLSNTSNLAPVVYDTRLFETPPLSLQPAGDKDDRYLLVVFEAPSCNPCARFHRDVLSNQAVQARLKDFRAVQLDVTDKEQKITTPSGQASTPGDWANQLQINYDIAVLFFDPQGKEVHRIDSECGKDRLLGSMQYVLEQAYLRHEQFLQWRKEQAQKKRNNQSP